MKLLPGYRLVVAPSFHASSDWARRLSLGAAIERRAESLLPHPPWRQASDEELALLVLGLSPPTPRQELADCLCLFVVPAHLRAALWDLLARARDRGEVFPDDFNAFVAEVAGFLTFKQLPPPAGAPFELVVSKPGQTAALGPLWGMVNLGEDATA